jgi:hypothetical protein
MYPGDSNSGCLIEKFHFFSSAGIAFEEDKVGKIIVGEVIKDGNAYKSGLVDAGDELIATSAIVYGSEEDYQGVMVRKGMQIVRLGVRGERFETVRIQHLWACISNKLLVFDFNISSGFHKGDSAFTFQTSTFEIRFSLLECNTLFVHQFFVSAGYGSHWNTSCLHQG